MAFVSKDLSVLAYANGFTQWHYTHPTDDVLALVTPGYFDGAVEMLRQGDMIVVNVVTNNQVTLLSIVGNDGSQVSANQIV